MPLPPTGPISFRGRKAKFAKGAKGKGSRIPGVKAHKPKNIKQKRGRTRRVPGFKELTRIVDMSSREAHPSTTDAARKAEYNKLQHSTLRAIGSVLSHLL